MKALRSSLSFKSNIHYTREHAYKSTPTVGDKKTFIVPYFTSKITLILSSIGGAGSRAVECLKLWVHIKSEKLDSFLFKVGIT